MFNPVVNPFWSPWIYQKTSRSQEFLKKSLKILQNSQKTSFASLFYNKVAV